MKRTITFPYKKYESASIPEQNLFAVLQPKQGSASAEDELETIRSGLKNPIGTLPLRRLAQSKKSVLILVDDYTRTTPTHLILPEVIAEIEAAGVAKQRIRLLIASGTHRAMTRKEKIDKFGRGIVSKFRLLDHHWEQEEQLVHLPATPGGTEVFVNKHLLEADFVIGIGHIVPHRVAGFSGGAKIVQPGVCGATTTGRTHWMSALCEGSTIMGTIDNPVRREINSVGKQAGLKFIVNTVHDGRGKVRRCVCGDPIEAFSAGCATASEVYGAALQEQADIVLADAFPADAELWQAAKGIFSADLALSPGGVLILVSPCPEGVSVEHPAIVDIGYKPFAEVEAMVREGAIRDLTLAAHLAHVGRVICDKGQGILVSKGIDRSTAARLGFRWTSTPQEALDLAFAMKGKQARVVVLKNGGETMPVLRP